MSGLLVPNVIDWQATLLRWHTGKFGFVLSVICTSLLDSTGATLFTVVGDIADGDAGEVISRWGKLIAVMSVGGIFGVLIFIMLQASDILADVGGQTAEHSPWPLRSATTRP